MRICVLALALIALSQPAFARSHSHHHQAHYARSHHAHHFARARMPMMEPGTIAFVRTNASDRPVFSDPSFPNRSYVPNRAWRQSAANRTWGESNWTQWNEGGWNQSWSQPAQSYGSSEYTPRARVARAAVRNTALDAMIARHAAANGIPVELVHRVVKRESGYNARALSKGNFGLMQIRYATARGIGYTGSPAGLLNAETNLTYAVKYLAGAYRAAGGNANRAVAYYASGYHGRGVQVARRRAVPSDSYGWQSGSGSGWQSAPVGMRTDAWRGMI